MSQADEEQTLPPAQEAELLEALEAALRPSALDPDLNQRLIEMALLDPLAAPSEEELVESARLRDALEQGEPHEDLGLLAALRNAGVEPSGDEAAVERAVERALGEKGRGAEGPRGPARRGKVIYAAFGAAAAAMAAAAVMMLFVGTAREAAPPVAAEYRKPRTTAPLFSERFETGDTTARMDAIASARSRDLRDNRYASWGVR